LSRRFSSDAYGTTTNQTANYAYPNLSTTSGTKSHTLNSISGANAWTYAYDASGNTIKEGTNVGSAATTQFTLTYDAKNRLNKTQIGTNTADFVTYKINATGQRVQKTGAGTYAYNAATASSFQYNARYVYDESGNLIGEYAPDGKLIAETVWFNGMPIATLRPKGANSGTPLGISGTTTGNPANGATAANANNVETNTTTNRVNVEVFYVHADHLGTPRTVTRSTIATGANAPSSATPTSPGAINKSVWSWYSDPFGTTGTTGAGGSANSAPNKNPQLVTGTAAQIAAATFEQNLRMPGQIEDVETKKFYNWNRTYANDVGRYNSSDPIGLLAGLNTFAYVENDPIQFIDPNGLQVVLPPGTTVPGFGGAIGGCCRSDRRNGDTPPELRELLGNHGSPPIFNTPAPPSNDEIIDAAPVPGFKDLGKLSDCTVGRRLIEPALAKKYRGGVSIQQEYFCACGQITRHTIIVGGRIVHDHFRPGPPKIGGD
jgi:RHS repeat-associated protein